MGLPFPQNVLKQHIAVLGKTGAGKSSALRVIVEHLLENNKRTVIIDPKGDWWGLKSSANGKSAGFPVIAFGNFKEEKATDIPMNDHSGAQIAELIATGNRPAIIGFRGWMPNQMVRFWLDFAPTLFNRNEGELYVVIDEVHNFAPKGKILDPNSGKCLHWTNRILSEGRGLGLTFFVASQRPQKVHNDTLDCCETLVAMRVAHPAARQSIKDWIDGNGDPTLGKKVLNTLAQLKRGEAWVWSPEDGFGPEHVKFPMFSTFDSFAPPQLQKKISQSGWSEVDLDSVKEKLSIVIAEAQANDPKELRKKIVELERQLKSKPPVQQAPPNQAVLDRAVTNAVLQRDKEHERSIKALLAKVEKMGTAMKGIAKVAAQFEATENVIVNKPLKAFAVAAPTSTPVFVRPVKQERVAAETGEISGPEQRILNAIAWMETIGVNQPSQAAVAFLAGYTIGGGAFNNPRGRLNQRGLVRYLSGDGIELTDSGRAMADAPATPLTATELQRMVLDRLPGPEKKLLSVLLEVGTDGLSNEELAERAGYAANGGAYNNPRGRLRSMGLIDYQSGVVMPKAFLFLN